MKMTNPVKITNPVKMTNTIERNEKRDAQYLGIPSKGVFCSLNCPETISDNEDVICFRSIYEALHAGFAPCPVCQPDMKSDRIVLGTEVSPLVNRAVEFINDGYLSGHTTEDLSEELHVSERHLRRSFANELGFSPTSLAAWHRAIFARHLLQKTVASVTDIAYTSGFGSVRQFNQVIRDVYGRSPTEIRREAQKADSGRSLYIEYGHGFDFRECLDELSRRIVPGVETITGSSYIRSFRVNGSAGYAKVSDDPENNRLRLEIRAENRSCYLAVYHKIRRMFDIGRKDADILRELGTDSFGGYLKEHSVPRLLLWFDQAASVHYAVIRRELEHGKAIEALEKYACYKGDPVSEAPEAHEAHEGISRIYPEGISIDPEAGKLCGFSERACRITAQLEDAINGNHVALAYNQSYRRFRQSMMKYTEIEEPAVNYIAMFGLGMKNAYTYEQDWLISLNLEQWNDYRSYAALIYNITSKG